MITIHKYPLKITEVQDVPMPEGAHILSVQYQSATETLCLWAAVNTQAAMKAKRIRIVGTGHPVPPAPMVPMGTVQCGGYVWHVFLDIGDLPVAEQAKLLMR